MKRLYEPQAYENPVGSYWETTASAEPCAALTGETSAHTVIIGGGYTGLNCALQLAESGIDPASIIILEAEQPGFGASGRNGGFCCLGGSKLTVRQAIARFGEKETLFNVETQKAAIETVRSNLSRFAINADTHSDGETRLAYRPSNIGELEAEKRQMKELFNIDSTFISPDKMKQAGLHSPDFHAALTTPVGFALNPMKYVLGLARAAQDAGIVIYGHSPVTRIERISSGWRTVIPKGTVTARNLVIATNGYSSEDVPEWLAGRLMPVLTNIIATRPLTPQELADQGWTSHQMCYDTRHSLHYFRLMPGINGEGPRMLFGMRGGTSATRHSNDIRHRKIRADFERIFPAWRGVETPWFWSGLVCLTQNLISYTGPIPEMENAWASLAYHGNGVALGSHSGRQLARMIAGEMAPDAMPAQMRQPPVRFPFPALRRTYLQAAFRWYEWLDK